MSSSIDVAVVTGGFTLAAGVLTYLGSGLRQRQQLRHDERAAHNQQVAEVAAAADDLRQRVQLYRTTWALSGDKGLAAGVEVGRMARGLLPDSAGSNPAYFLVAATLTTASELLVP